MLKWVITSGPHNNNNNISKLQSSGYSSDGQSNGSGEQDSMDKRFEELGITCPTCNQDATGDEDTNDGFVMVNDEDGAEDEVFDLPIFVRVSATWPWLPACGAFPSESPS